MIMLTDRERKRLEQEREALVEQLRGLGNLMRGTVIQVGVKCGRAGCGCERGEKHRKVHLSVNLGGRTRGCYLGREREPLVAPLIAEYQRAGGRGGRGGGRHEPRAAAVRGGRGPPRRHPDGAGGAAAGGGDTAGAGAG